MNQAKRLFFLGSLVILGILLIVGIMGYNVGSSTLIEESQNRLTQARLSKTIELQKDFESLNKSLLFLVEHPGIQGLADSKPDDKTPIKPSIPHELIRRIQRESELQNILIVDRDARVRLTVNRNILRQGQIINAKSAGQNLMDAVKWTQGSPYLQSRYFDFERIDSKNSSPFAYLAAPIYVGGKNKGSVIFKMSLSRLENILSNNHDWSRLGLKRTGEIVIFGRDGLLRNNPRIFYEDQNKIFRNHFQDPPSFKINPAMRLGLPPSTVQDYLARGEFIEKNPDYLGRPSLQSIGKVSLQGDVEWLLVARMDQEEASVPITKNIFILIVAGLVLGLSGYLVASRFSKQMLHPLREISKAVNLFKNHSSDKRNFEGNWNDFQRVCENINSLTHGYGELQKTKDFLERTMDSLSEALFIVRTSAQNQEDNISFYIVAVNPAASRMLGSEFSQLKGQDLKTWVETDYSQVRRSHAKSFDGMIKRKDGRRIPLELSSSVFPTSEVGSQYYVIVGRDVSWKKEIERELRLQEKLLQQSQAISKIGSFCWNIESGTLVWSEELYKILGLLPFEVVPSYDLFRNFIVPEDQPLFDRALLDSKAGEKVFQVDFRIRRADNNEISWIRAHGRFELDSESNSVVMYGTNQDITEVRRVEISLITSKDEALKSSQAKSEFLARMSHEIRTPMNAIMGMAELLSETKLDQDQRHYVTIFVRAGEVLMNLINDILDLSKIEAGEVSIENIPLEISKLMSEVEDIMQPRAVEKGLLYSYEIAPDIANFVMGDPNKLRQILINLVGNALKFTEHGEIKVQVVRHPQRKGTMQMSVRDTGLGIPADKQHLIFQKFSQADSSITRRFGGTGLGLAISKSLVELMGGKIWFESTEKVGTTFFITMPYHEAVLSPVTQRPLQIKSINRNPPQPAKRDLKGRKLRILIADDTGDNRTLFTHFLKNEDYEIIEAENGLEAVSQVKSQNFDLIFMDVQMPEMDGYAATGEIRKWEQSINQSPVPIVALTAHALSEDRQKSIDAGCDDHIAKPFRKDTLLKVINRYS